jgi:hypothetical protein
MPANGMRATGSPERGSGTFASVAGSKLTPPGLSNKFLPDIGWRRGPSHCL